MSRILLIYIQFTGKDFGSSWSKAGCNLEDLLVPKGLKSAFSEHEPDDKNSFNRLTKMIQDFVYTFFLFAIITANMKDIYFIK